MGREEDIKSKLAEKHITKINGQTIDQDQTKLKLELIKIPASVATIFDEGKHSHIVLIIPKTKYIGISHKGKKMISQHIPDIIQRIFPALKYHAQNKKQRRRPIL